MVTQYSASGRPQHYTQDDPCPICGGGDDDPRGQGVRCKMGFPSSDGRYAHCGNDRYVGGLSPDPNGVTYPHRLGGLCKCGATHEGAAQPRAPKPEKKPREFHGRQYLPQHVRQNGDDYTCEGLYEFRAPDGAVHYLEGRYERPSADGSKPDKTFRPFTYRGGDVWVMAMECEPLLWNLPAILAAPVDAPIYAFEGPRKARLASEALQAVGAIGVVTATSGGSGGTVKTVDMSALAGKRIVIFRDNDEKGQTFTETFARRALEAGAAQVCVALLPDLPPAGDVVEYLAAGHDGADLARAASAAIRFTTPTDNAACMSETLNSTPECNFAIRETDGELRGEAPLDDLAAVRRIEGHIMATRNLNSAPKQVAIAALRALRDLPHEKMQVGADGRVQVVASYRDSAGNPQLTAEMIAEFAGVSKSTVSRHMPAVAHAGILKPIEERYFAQDGTPRKRVYYQLGPNALPRPEAPVFPEPLQFGRKRNGGRRVQVPTACGQCGSTHITIRAELVCLEPECGHVEPLNLDPDEQAGEPETAETLNSTPECNFAIRETLSASDEILPSADVTLQTHFRNLGASAQGELVALASSLNWPAVRLANHLMVGGDRQMWETFVQNNPALIESALAALRSQRQSA